MQMAKGAKTILKILGALYVAFLVLLFVQHFHRQEKYVLPALPVLACDVDAVTDAQMTGELLPAAVTDPVEMRWHRFEGPLRSRSQLAGLKKMGVRRFLAFEGDAAKDARAFVARHIRLRAPVKDPSTGEVIVDRGYLIHYRELALLMNAGYGGRDVVVEGRGTIVQINATTAFVILNFLLLVALLYAFLWEPLTRAMDARAARIQEDMNRAQSQRQKAEQLRARYESAMSRAHIEAEDLKHRKLKEAVEEGDRVIKRSKRDANRMMEDARKQIRAEFIEARKRLRAEVAHISIAIAERILKREIDRQKHHQTIQEFLAELEVEDEKQTGA